MDALSGPNQQLIGPIEKSPGRGWERGWGGVVREEQYGRRRGLTFAEDADDPVDAVICCPQAAADGVQFGDGVAGGRCTMGGALHGVSLWAGWRRAQGGQGIVGGQAIVADFLV